MEFQMLRMKNIFIAKIFQVIEGVLTYVYDIYISAPVLITQDLKLKQVLRKLNNYYQTTINKRTLK